MSQLFRVFVSSTYIDLIDYRKAAEKAINDLGQKFEGMNIYKEEEMRSLLKHV